MPGGGTWLDAWIQDIREPRRNWRQVGPGCCTSSHGAQLSLSELLPTGPMGVWSDLGHRLSQAPSPAAAEAEVGQGYGQLLRAPHPLALRACP